MSKEDLSDLPIEERVRLARNEIDLKRDILEQLREADPDREGEMMFSIWKRWGLMNKEGIEAVQKQSELDVQEASERHKEAMKDVYRNPIAMVLYFRDWLKRR